MKKSYQKPVMTFMRLRPEEKLAVCEWLVGFSTSGNSCQKTWAEVAGWSAICQENYNNAPVSGS